MLDIESITRNATAKSLRLIQASPEALRECASRLERASNLAFQGESVICELTPGIHVVHKPYQIPDRSIAIYPDGSVEDSSRELSE